MPEFIAGLDQYRAPDKRILRIMEHKKAVTSRKLFLVKWKSVEESKQMKKVVRVIRKTCCSR